ncbi:hypothetical protein [Komagataeibacter sp. FXV3]|uniref:hypothetical protein n=1 Tax=Komagataeibacter sp. FXV3 TaxID=2608998 RepID=UPI00187B3E22|nr:hypothetical protein [Komagataeibacter sp. FXV3]MBE7730211.1 hypothetical protein [Komagataeibacter sp. FXV3]
MIVETYRSNRLFHAFLSRIGGVCIVLLPVGGLAGCGYTDSRTAHRAQLAMIGMNSTDVQSCVGIPDKIKKIDDHVQIFEYSRTLNIPSTNDSTFVPLQTLVNLTETTVGGAGKTCVADIRIEDDKVVDLHYSGDDDEIIGSDGVCSIVTRGCVRKPVASMRHVKRGPLGPISAFHPPRTPAVPAEETTPAPTSITTATPVPASITTAKTDK